MRSELGLIEQVTVATRAAVLTQFRKDSCIATTRCLIDVLDYYGVSARPFPALALAFNARAAELFTAGVPREEWPSEAWSIGTDRNAADGHFPHLVALTYSHLIDGSLDQMSRPHKNLALEPSVFTVPEGWDRTERLALQRSDGVLIAYEPFRDASFRTSRNWSRRQPDIKQVIGLAIRELNAAGATPFNGHRL